MMTLKLVKPPARPPDDPAWWQDQENVRAWLRVRLPALRREREQQDQRRRDAAEPPPPARRARRGHLRLLPRPDDPE